MLSETFTKSLAAASANNICTSQALASAGNLNLNGSTVVSAQGTANTFGYIPAQAVLDTQRRILFTPAGAEAGKIATIIGTNDYGGIISENLTMVSNPSTVASALDYKTVLRISFAVALASTITVGTNTTGSTPWIGANHNVTPFQITVNIGISGSVTYQGETTLSDPFTAVNNPTLNTTPQPVVYTALASSSSAQEGTLTSACRAWRMTITSGTGTLTVQGEQAGIING